MVKRGLRVDQGTRLNAVAIDLDSFSPTLPDKTIDFCLLSLHENRVTEAESMYKACRGFCALTAWRQGLSLPLCQSEIDAVINSGKRE